jgi:hypothetical protein
MGVRAKCPDTYLGEFKRGETPLFMSLPLSFEGEGDTGGEVY